LALTEGATFLDPLLPSGSLAHGQALKAPDHQATACAGEGAQQLWGNTSARVEARSFASGGAWFSPQAFSAHVMRTR